MKRIFFNITTLSCLCFLKISFTKYCDKWMSDHLYNSSELHLANTTFVYLRINSISDLNVTSKCPKNEINSGVLKIYANRKILLDNDLDMTNMMDSFANKKRKIDAILMQNFKGFSQKIIKANKLL